MALQMVHSNHRQPAGKGKTPRQCRAGQQRTDQARSGRMGHTRELCGGRVGLGQGLAQQRQQAAQVIARGQFGYHPAIGAVQFYLAEQSMRE